jgi:hypothetical protein
MHDPEVVAFDICRPWPRTDRSGRRRWPVLFTVWHHEPGGKDALSVCGHDSQWQLHVWHWRISSPWLRGIRRRLLTRCAWCGGRSAPEDPVNVSHDAYSDEDTRWWQGESNLFHHWCSSADRAWNTCTCLTPKLEPGREFGFCANCDRFRKWRLEDWERRQAQAWRQDVAVGEHPSQFAYERAVSIYQLAKKTGEN